MIRYINRGIKTLSLLFFLVFILASCAATGPGRTPRGAPAGVALEGQKWYLTELAGRAVEVPPGSHRPFLVLNADKKSVGGNNGCNIFFGDYKLSGRQISFSGMGSTKMACYGPEGRTEMGFMEALRKAGSWEIRDGALFLGNGSRSLARFVREETGRK